MTVRRKLESRTRTVLVGQIGFFFFIGIGLKRGLEHTAFFCRVYARS